MVHPLLPPHLWRGLRPTRSLAFGFPVRRPRPFQLGQNLAKQRAVLKPLPGANAIGLHPVAGDHLFYRVGPAKGDQDLFEERTAYHRDSRSCLRRSRKPSASNAVALRTHHSRGTCFCPEAEARLMPVPATCPGGGNSSDFKGFSATEGTTGYPASRKHPLKSSTSHWWVLAERPVLMPRYTPVRKFHSGIAIRNTYPTLHCRSASARSRCKGSGRQYPGPCHRGIEPSRWVRGGTGLQVAVHAASILLCSVPNCRRRTPRPAAPPARRAPRPCAPRG